jgi:hypothetical protein
MQSRFEISVHVQKYLRQNKLNADEIIRKALNIRVDGFTTSEGKFLPEGTVLIAWFKEKPLAATVKNGGIQAEGKTYSSLSGAAAHYTGRATTNGWDFWYARPPGKTEFIPVQKAAELMKAA